VRAGVAVDAKLHQLRRGPGRLGRAQVVDGLRARAQVRPALVLGLTARIRSRSKSGRVPCTAAQAPLPRPGRGWPVSAYA